MYATKKRKRIMKQLKNALSGGQEVTKSNPSKRHRERLNSELDHLASLLPYEQGVISKLDKLSVLRLAVNYLRTKSYFQAAIYDKSMKIHSNHYADHYHHYHQTLLLNNYKRPIANQDSSKVNGEEVTTTTLSDPTCIAKAEDILQALNGFLLVVTCEGEVFFASDTVEQYLGFHQSDIIHQSVMELIHSEDREQFKLQLFLRPSLNLQELTSDHVNDSLVAINQQFRRFTVRFRCLLDNTSGFITLELTGRLRVLYGQNLKSNSSKTLALFALCSPLGVLPPSEVQGHELTFKSKHKMDMSRISLDARGKTILGYSERELSEKGGYDLVHYDDSAYYAAAHQELIKTGSSGLIVYRLLNKDFQWVWLQTSSKAVYKNSKPDFINCVHRQLTADEGNDLLGKRGSEFKLPYALIYDLVYKTNEDSMRPNNQSTSFQRQNISDENSDPDSAKSETHISTSGSSKHNANCANKTDPTNLSFCSSTSFCSENKTNNRSKPQRNQKKVREHLKEYLQAGRRRKTPYREISKTYAMKEVKVMPRLTGRSESVNGRDGNNQRSPRDDENNYRRDIDGFQPSSGHYYESTCNHQTKPHAVFDDWSDFNHYMYNDDLMYYGQSHPLDYYHKYHNAHNVYNTSNNGFAFKDLQDGQTNFYDHHNPFYPKHQTLQLLINDRSIVREEIPSSPYVVSPCFGATDSRRQEPNLNAYAANPENPYAFDHQHKLKKSNFDVIYASDLLGHDEGSKNSYVRHLQLTNDHHSDDNNNNNNNNKSVEVERVYRSQINDNNNNHYHHKIFNQSYTSLLISSDNVHQNLNSREFSEVTNNSTTEQYDYQSFDLHYNNIDPHHEINKQDQYMPSLTTHQLEDKEMTDRGASVLRENSDRMRYHDVRCHVSPYRVLLGGCQIGEVGGGDCQPGNHRSVIRLNNRCLQQAVPVIQNPSANK